VAIYHIEIASHSFAMTYSNTSRLNATWYQRFLADLIWNIAGQDEERMKTAGKGIFF